VNVLEIQKLKTDGKKITMVTCYDYAFGRLIAQTDIEIVLVGDSVSMVVHGFPDTLHATTEMMALHTAAVARAVQGKFLVTDMPFPTHRRGIPEAMSCVDVLMKAGAQAVKIEGTDGHEDVIRHIIASGVPVMGHIGLLPQSIHRIGGYKVHGREVEGHYRLIEQALILEDLGCFSIVLECIPTDTAAAIAERVRIPAIGIGAGPRVDGQVLVLHDLLGLTAEPQPRFVRRFLDGTEAVVSSLRGFQDAVRAGSYPTKEESYE
jgi:3-methyl-2-oxobutanoate hydroxymethyltransferase